MKQLLKLLLKKIRPQKKNKPSNIYAKCNELPIHNFNEVANNNDFSYLKKDRNLEERDEDLQKAWIEILDEFLIISKNQYATNTIKKKIKILQLQNKIEVFELMKYCTSRGINIDAELKEYKVQKEKLNVQLGLLKNDLSRITSSISKDDDPKGDSAFFERTLAKIMQSGFHINRFTTVVTEWVSIMNLLEEQNKK